MKEKIFLLVPQTFGGVPFPLHPQLQRPCSVPGILPMKLEEDRRARVTSDPSRLSGMDSYSRIPASLFIQAFLSVMLFLHQKGSLGIRQTQSEYCKAPSITIRKSTFFKRSQNTMRTNLLNYCHLVSISKNVMFYAFLVVRIY